MNMCTKTKFKLHSLFTLIQIAVCNEININGNFLASRKELEYLKYFLSYRKNLDGLKSEKIPIFPFTSISALVLDEKQLSESLPKYYKIEELISVISSRLNFASEKFQLENNATKSIDLPEEIKIATFFTAGNNFDEDFKWDKFADSSDDNLVEIRKLKEWLELFIPKKFAKSYDITIKNFKLSSSVIIAAHSFGESSNSNYSCGVLRLELIVPFNSVFSEKFYQDYEQALRVLKNRLRKDEYSKLVRRIKEFNNGSVPIFRLIIRRNFLLEEKDENSGQPRYNFSFLEEKFLKKKHNLNYNLEIDFEIDSKFRLFNIDLPFRLLIGNYLNLGLNYCTNIGTISSEFEEHFKEHTEKVKPDNTTTNRRGIWMVIFWFFLVFIVFFLLLSGYFLSKEDF